MPTPSDLIETIHKAVETGKREHWRYLNIIHSGDAPKLDNCPTCLIFSGAISALDQLIASEREAAADRAIDCVRCDPWSEDDFRAAILDGQSASPKEKHCGRPHPHLRQSCLPGIWQCDDCRAASATPLQEARDRGGAMSDHSANPDRENPCGNCFNQGQDCEANPERDCTGWERDIPRRFLHVNIGDWVAYRCYSVGQEAFPWIIVRWDDDHIVNGEWIEAVKVIETRAEAEARAALAAEGKA
jgi:ribosomal protein L37AE/L43A